MRRKHAAAYLMVHGRGRLAAAAHSRRQLMAGRVCSLAAICDSCSVEARQPLAAWKVIYMRPQRRCGGGGRGEVGVGFEGAGRSMQDLRERYCAVQFSSANFEVPRHWASWPAAAVNSAKTMTRNSSVNIKERALIIHLHTSTGAASPTGCDTRRRTRLCMCSRHE